MKVTPSQIPSGPALLLASSLHCAWRGVGGVQTKNHNFRATLEMLGQVKERQHKQVEKKPINCFFSSRHINLISYAYYLAGTIHNTNTHTVSVRSYKASRYRAWAAIVQFMLAHRNAYILVQLSKWLLSRFSEISDAKRSRTATDIFGQRQWPPVAPLSL